MNGNNRKLAFEFKKGCKNEKIEFNSDNTYVASGDVVCVPCDNFYMGWGYALFGAYDRVP